MANGKDYTLEIKIAGEVAKSFSNTMKYTKKELDSISKEAKLISHSVRDDFNIAINDMEPMFGSLEKTVTRGFKTMVAGATALSIAVGTIGTAAANVGIKYESAFAGVKKTTEATAYEYRQLSKEILDTADNIPATAVEISEVAENAGQLGIAKDYLLEFSEIMIGLGESTNLSATEASSSLAKFANITNMASTEYSNLGSTIVALGNNFATTEADIVEMATRLAATGELTGLSQAQIMALATAMSSVGIEAEAGGSAMSKLLKKIQVAVETGSDSLNDYASIANMSSEEFKKSFGEDAIGALSSFISGLNDTERNGQSAISILDDMGLTEVRLSNTILSLANANGVMADAVSTANKAWDENTALTNEVEQRYATMESQLSIAQNRITGIGIDMYEDFQGPMAEIVSDVNGMLGELGNDVENSHFISNLTEEIPTLKREVQETAEALGEFAEPFLDVGEFLINHDEVLIGAVVGIGGALATYKVEKGIMGLVNGFSKLSGILTNQFALTLTGISVAIGGVTGIAAAVKKANTELKKQNLSEHFGDISLSMQELEDTAAHIIQTDSIGKISDVMNSFDNIESLKSSIDSAINEIDKANWKVSIGMELDESDRENYVANIESFINDCQQTLAEGQFAMSLNLDILTDDNAYGNAIKTQFNSFYESQSAELAELGTKLSETVNKAFEDDLLTVDEAKEVAELQAQMAAITEKIASSRFDAKMEMLEMEYAGGNLDAETFQNLQAELNEQAENAKLSLNESLEMNVAQAAIMLDDGKINQSEYENMVAEFKENYLEQVGEIELKASNFQIDTIKSQYADTLEKLSPELQEQTQLAIDKFFENYNNGESLETSKIVLFSAMEDIDISKGDSKAIAELYKYIEAIVDGLEETRDQYMGYGGDNSELIEKINRTISSSYEIGSMAGNESAMMNYAGQMIGSDAEYTQMAEEAEKAGKIIPEEFSKGITDNQQQVYDSIDTLRKEVITMMSNPMSVNIPISVGTSLSTVAAQEEKLKLKNGHADGGIFNQYHIAEFCEGNSTEAVIPIDGTQNAFNLWETTGKLLGIIPNENAMNLNLDGIGGNVNNNSSIANGYQISYNPTFQFNGAAPSKQDIVEASRSSYEDFERFMEQYIRNNNRTSFA